MEIPENATRGILFSYKKNKLSRDKSTPFDIYLREGEDRIIIKWETPSFYSVAIGDDYMSKYSSIQGIITKRKNGKWMFQGHQRLYANQQVVFY